MTYEELKKKHQKEVNDFPLGFAFSNSQFDEMMKKWELDPENDLDKIVSIGAGGFIRKQDISAYKEMSKRFAKELEDFRKNEKEFIKGLVYQLHNHEYGYSRSNDDIIAACEALGIGEEELQDKHVREMINKAIKQCVKEYNEVN